MQDFLPPLVFAFLETKSLRITWYGDFVKVFIFYGKYFTGKLLTLRLRCDILSAEVKDMTTVTDEKILRLQQNLPIIRNLAGWTAEDLGDRIGVTRQTITNIEKSESLSMTKTQYIAIRAVLDYEIENTKNKVLSDTISVLIDADDLSESQTKQVTESVKNITSQKSRRVNDKFVLEGVTAMIAALGAIGSLTLSQLPKKNTSIPKWLSDLMK